MQAQQQSVPAPAPMPHTSVPQQSSRPNGAPARPAPASPPGQGRAVRPALPPSNGKLTLGAALPPHVAAQIAQAKAQATPAPAPGPSPAKSTPAESKRHPDRPPLTERLTALFPIAFDFHKPVPLALGIEQQIATALGIHPKIASAALGRWCKRVNYLSATAAPGSRRFNLDGSDAGEVSDDHRAHAAETLARKLAPNTPGALAAGSHNSPHATGKDRDMARIIATARKMKVTTVLDVAAFADMPPISDNAPSRTALTVNVAGRKFTADIATKSVRRALAVIAEHGADGVAVLVQGTLGEGDEITEAGLTAQPKAPAKAAAA